MRIACFNPELQDLEGCSPTDDIALEQLESLRKKRYVHEVSRYTPKNMEEESLYCRDNAIMKIVGRGG